MASRRTNQNPGLLSALTRTAAAAVDRAATLAATAGSRGSRNRSRAEGLSHAERVEALQAIAESYGGSGERYFRAARSIDPIVRPVRGLGGEAWHKLPGGAPGSVLDLTWSSDYTCYLPALDERYGSHRANRSASARLFVGAGAPRPVMLLIHGYLGGQFAAEERVWPVRWLFRRGFDVALLVLPFHGVRQEPGRRGPPPFPGADPRISNEGFRQAMADARDLIAWLGRRGHPQVGVMGMSLGGYSAALLATLEPDLAFAVPVIPLASLADFARDQGRLGSSLIEREVEHAALERAHRVVSPLHRPLKLGSERVLIIGAEADQITPIAHARRLASHFRATLDTWPGGHLLQLGRGEAFRRIGRFVTELGVLEPGPDPG